MNSQHALQLITLIMAIAGVAVWVVWAIRNRQRWLYSVPPLSWLVHIIIFYFAVFVRDFGLVNLAVYDFTVWSAIIRLQVAFLVIGIGLMLYRERMIITR